MAKKHWRESPVGIRTKIERWLQTTRDAPIDGWLAAASIAWGAGYDLDAPPRSATDRLAQIEASGDVAYAGTYRTSAGAALAGERQALIRWEGMRQWAATEPDSEELVERARKVREEAAKQEKIKQRAEALLAEDAEKRRAKALERAAKEAEATNGS